MARTTAPREIGSTGLKYANNYLYEDESVPDLRFPYSIKAFDRMKTDPIISGTLFVIKQFIRKVDWDIKPKGGLTATPEAQRQAEIIRKALFEDMERSFDQVISDICSFIDNGFAFFEPAYKVTDGLILWRDIPARHATSLKGFKFDERGRLTAIEQYQISSSGSGFQYVGTTKEIPASRLLHFRTDSEKNNPLGRSVLKNAYKAWYFKTKLEEHEAIGVEREMNGLPLIKMPIEYFNATKEDNPEMFDVFQEMVRMGQNARNNEQACVVIPSDSQDESNNPMFSFELISSNGTRSLDTSKIIERYDYRIAQSLISDFMLMGSTSTGSFALSDNKLGAFVRSLEAYLEVIAEQFNRRAIPKVYEMNGWDVNEKCELVHKPIGSAGIAELGKYLSDIKHLITPDEALENALRLRADLPEKDVDNQYIDTPTATHQAISQRIGMESSARRSGGDTHLGVLGTVEGDNPTALEKSLKESLEGRYDGEA